MLTRNIPATGEPLPLIGLGTWQTFDTDATRYDVLRDVLKTVHSAGGRLIDSSPMYGRAEKVIGDLTANMPEGNDFFYATKVWTQGLDSGKAQLANSFSLMKRKVLDLVQIHNLVDWQTHLPYLRRLKEEGKLRYIGFTHYHDSSHEALADLIRKEPVDFVQFNYSLLSRKAESLLLPLCADKGIATLINRPFGEGNHFRWVANKPLPPWAAEMGIGNWGAFFLSYIVAHPAVTCVIPATSNPAHAQQNMEAASRLFPDGDIRQKMIAYIQKV